MNKQTLFWNTATEDWWWHLVFPPPPLSGSGPSGPSSGGASPGLIPLPSHSVPDFSYSSSEDEFYDADEFYQSTTSPKHCIEWVQQPPRTSMQPALHRGRPTASEFGSNTLLYFTKRNFANAVKDVCNRIVCEIRLILLSPHLSGFLPPVSFPLPAISSSRPQSLRAFSRPAPL